LEASENIFRVFPSKQPDAWTILFILAKLFNEWQN